MEIKSVESEVTHSLRTQVLNSKRRERPGDDEALHLAIYDKMQVIGISSFFPQNQDEIFQTGHWRIRGMVVIPEYQKQGIGRQMLDFFMKSKIGEIKELWCNARIGAEGFYTKLGFISIGIIERRKDVWAHRMTLRFE
jgi:GNAT superfamily N-acetyltransferase